MKNKLSTRFFFSACVILCVLSVKLSAQSGFLPSDITGLKLWLKGDSVQTTVPPLIDKCYDNSSLANNALQPTSGSQPSSITSNLNGHRTMLFDGTDDHLSFNEIADIRTVFWVIKEDNVASSDFRSLLGHSSAYDFVRGDSKQIWNSSYSNSFVLSGVTKLNEIAVNGALQVLPANYSIVSLVTTGNVKAANFSSERNLVGRFWYGELAELIIYNQPLTPAEVIQVETYLHNKYAPPVKLGADITITDGFCDTTLSTGTWFKSFLWSTGETTQKISVNKSGNYWVKAVDVFGRLSQDTINVTYPPVNYTGGSLLCPGTNKVWDIKYPKSKYTFKWQDNSTDSLFSITQAGKYYVTITDLAACSITSDTAVITVDDIASVISLGNDTSFCAGNTIGLTKGAIKVTSYMWSTGSTNPTIPVLISGKYWVTVKSANNCSATDTINVTVTGTAPVAEFSFANTCLKNTTVFTDVSTSIAGQPIVSWNWTFGDVSTSSLQHPTHVYADTGKYTVKLTVQTASCAGSVTKVVQLYPRPKIDFAATGFFQNFPTSFTGQAITFNYPITSWKWNFGDPASGAANISTLQNPVHTYTKMGTYAITLIAVNGQGCADTVTKTIFIDSKAALGNVPQLKVWLRADTLVTLNPDNTINSWKDIKGGTLFTSATLAQSPSLKADVPTMNNNAYANFNGSNGMLSQSTVKLKNYPTTVLIVGQLNAITTYGYWLCYGVASPGNWQLYEIKNSGRLAFIHSNDNLGAGIDATGSGSGDPAGNTTVLDKHPSIVMGTTNPLNAQWSLYENQTLKHSAFSSPFSQAASSLMSLGYRTDVISYANFKMAELMIFDSTLSAAQFTDIKNYLQKRYSKKVSLGADIIVPYGFCNTTLTVSNPLFTSFKWSTGDTTKSIAVHKTGAYSVDVVDIYGFHSIDTVNITYPKLTANISNGSLCPGDSLVWDTHLSKKGYSFLWQNNSTDSLFVIKQAGTYVVKVTDSVGCFIVSDSVKIKLDGIATQVSLGADTTFCSGNTIGLVKGAGLVSSYLWSTGSVSTRIPVTTSGKYWVTVKSVNNCPATDTINVVISGIAPTSNFSFLNTCLENVTQFTDLSTPPAGEMLVSWNWNFGDASLSSLQNPTHVYADTGIYNVQLLVKTLNGCSESRTQSIHIYPHPKLSFTVSNLCEDINTSFKGQATLYGYPLTQWDWNFGDPASGSKNNSALQNPVHLFANGGIYTVNLKIENTKGCIDTLTKNVIINPAPVTDFSFSLACKDVAVLFKDLTVLPSGTTNAANYWSFGNGTSTQLNPTHTFSANVKYNVMHVVTSSNGCKDTMIKSVDVHATPKALFANSNGCEMNPTVFTDLSLISAGSITAWQWTFENKGNSTIKNPQYSFGKPGNAIVKHVVISDFGCKDSLTKTIVVYPKPLARFTNSPEYGNPGQVVTFTNTSTGATSYLWNFDDGGTSTVVNPSHIYAGIGSYLPKLVATSSIGCTDTAFGNVLILKRYMDVAITGITAQVQNGGGVLLNNYLTVRVNILNKSTSDVFALDLYLETSDGTAIKETWTGKLLKGNSMSYDFKAAPTVKAGDHFICVDVLNPNGLKDEIPIDNKVCEALDVSAFKILTPYPNPAEDLIIIPLIIPEDGELNMTIYDANGKEMEKMFSGSIAQGLQLMTLDTRIYNSGTYVCKVQLAGQTLFTKFIKK
jgi:PKD repeat protein